MKNRVLSPALITKLKKIKLLALDVDGVLTAGDIIVLKSGEEVKLWNSKDRLALALIGKNKNSLRLAWITGRSSPAVAWAAKDLGVPHLTQGCTDKRKALKDILDACSISFEETAFMGDDLIDVPALRAVGFSCCPSDAASDVLPIVDYVSPFNGGKGAVRDILELILRTQKKWDSLVHSFLV